MTKEIKLWTINEQRYVFLYIDHIAVCDVVSVCWMSYDVIYVRYCWIFLYSFAYLFIIIFEYGFFLFKYHCFSPFFFFFVCLSFWILESIKKELYNLCTLQSQPEPDQATLKPTASMRKKNRTENKNHTPESARETGLQNRRWWWGRHCFCFFFFGFFSVFGSRVRRVHV